MNPKKTHRKKSKNQKIHIIQKNQKTTTPKVLSTMDKIRYTKTLLAKNSDIHLCKDILNSSVHTEQSTYTYVELLYKFHQKYQSNINMILDALNMDTYFDFMIKLDHKEKYLSSASEAMLRNLKNFVLYPKKTQISPQLLSEASDQINLKDWVASLMLMSKTYNKGIVENHFAKYLDLLSSERNWNNRHKSGYSTRIESIFNTYIFKYTPKDVIVQILLYSLHNGVKYGQSILSMAILSNDDHTVKLLTDIYGVRICNISYFLEMFDIKMAIPIFSKLLSTHRDVVGDSYQSVINHITTHFIAYGEYEYKRGNICKKQAIKLIKFALFLGGESLTTIKWKTIVQFRELFCSVEYTSLLNLMWREMVLYGLGTMNFEDYYFNYVEFKE